MSELLKVCLWMSVAITGFTVMAIAGRAVTPHLDTFEIMAFRSLIGLLIVVVVGASVGRLREVRTNRLGLHLIRNSFHFAGQNLWFFSLSLIPLAQVFALEFSYPIWVALAAPLLLGERLTRTRLLAALIGFCGILIVVRPGFAEVNAGTLAAVLSAFGFAGSALFTKRLTSDQSITCILFWLTAMQAVMGLSTAALDGEITLPPAAIAPWIVVIAIAGLAAHLSLTTALSLAPATVVTPLDFARLPVIALVAAVIYGEAIDPFVLLGGAVILGAIYLNISREARNRRAAAS
jgi:drug/metabolite transporter (DMT)-like permease